MEKSQGFLGVWGVWSLSVGKRPEAAQKEQERGRKTKTQPKRETDIC